MATAKIEYKFPKTAGACADKFYELREKRLAAEKIAAAIESEEKAFKAHLIDTIPKSDATGVAGKLCRVSVVVKAVPQVKDWDAFHKYVQKNNAWDMLGKTISKEAITSRLDDKKKLPFIEMFNTVSLSVNKL